ncbi:MAG: VOC family protein [Nakamurella sp.]
MTVNLEQIVFDARDAATLAAFWSALLEQPVDPGASAEFASVGRTGPLPLPTPFLFMQVPEKATGKNRVHVDLDSATPEADVARAMLNGARRVDDHDEYDTRWTTLADPEGNVFDIVYRVP